MFAGLVSPGSLTQLCYNPPSQQQSKPAAQNILQFANISCKPATQQEKDTWFGPQHVQISLRLINWLSLQNVESAKLQQSPTVHKLFPEKSSESPITNQTIIQSQNTFYVKSYSIAMLSAGILLGKRGAVLHHSAETVLCFRNHVFFPSSPQSLSSG